ncbi:MAG TPA: YggS family pyridoxal phosphate-dependent enzyme [Acidimicrobiales bacterium]|nr:YggS family pyridoxal phosphate-dependent enzyme [Acidimicrobiales bacterium]
MTGRPEPATAAAGPTVDQAERAADLAARLGVVRDRVVAAGRRVDDVRIVAVTKGFGPAAADAAVRAGVTDLGENYAQELVGKAAAMSAHPAWHFLGPVQRNKVAALAPVVSCWHGLDRAAALEAVAARQPGARVLVQVNLVGDPAKHGCAPGEAAGLVGRGRDLGLDVCGLMTVAAAGDRPGASRTFAALATLAGHLGVRELSMGMSDDYDLAAAEGATMLRLGRALFGDRPPRPVGKDLSS